MDKLNKYLQENEYNIVSYPERSSYIKNFFKERFNDYYELSVDLIEKKIEDTYELRIRLYYAYGYNFNLVWLSPNHLNEENFLKSPEKLFICTSDEEAEEVMLKYLQSDIWINKGLI